MMILMNRSTTSSLLLSKYLVQVQSNSIRFLSSTDNLDIPSNTHQPTTANTMDPDISNDHEMNNESPKIKKNRNNNQDTDTYRKWIVLHRTPMYSTLRDIFIGLNDVTTLIQNYNHSIQDSNFGASASAKVPELNWQANLKEVRYYTSKDAMLRGFYLKFQDVDSVQSIAQMHYKKGWPMFGIGASSVKLNRVNEPNPNRHGLAANVLRVMPFMNNATEQDVRAIYKKYGLADERERRDNDKSSSASTSVITKLERSDRRNRTAFLVRFESAAAARMAHRMENVNRKNTNTRVFSRMYPDLTLPDDLETTTLKI